MWKLFPLFSPTTTHTFCTFILPVNFVPLSHRCLSLFHRGRNHFYWYRRFYVADEVT